MKIYLIVFETFFILNLYGQLSPLKFQQQISTTPQNIEECLLCLDNIFNYDEMTQCLHLNDEKDLMKFNEKYSQKLQELWLLNSFSSSLTRYFILHSVIAPSDMTEFIFRSYHRKLTFQPVAFYKQLCSYYDKNKMFPYPSKPVDRFKIGDTIRFTDVKYTYVFRMCIYSVTLKAVVEEKDTANNRIRILVFQIVKKYKKSNKMINKYRFRQKVYTIGINSWEDATFLRKEGELLGIDIY